MRLSIILKLLLIALPLSSQSFAESTHDQNKLKFWCNGVKDKKGYTFEERRINEGGVSSLKSNSERYGVYQKNNRKLTMVIFKNEAPQCVAVRVHDAKYGDTALRMAGLNSHMDTPVSGHHKGISCFPKDKFEKKYGDNLLKEAGISKFETGVQGDIGYLKPDGSWFIAEIDNENVCAMAFGQKGTLEDFLKAMRE